jgi:hypothetical protein
VACVLWGCAGDGTAQPDDTGGVDLPAQGGAGAGGDTQAGGSAGTPQGGNHQGGASGNTPGGNHQGGASGNPQGGSHQGGSAGSAQGGEDSGGSGGEGQGGEGQGGEGQGGTGASGSGGKGASGATGAAGKGGGGAAGAAGKGGGGSTAQDEVEMTFTTANIGRTYKTKADVQGVFDKIGDVLDAKSGPRFIGWQEIGEADPCGGSCEFDALTARFKESAGWDSHLPKGKRPDGGMETVKEPITAKGAEADGVSVRAVFGSPGWAGVSPTRFITVVHYAERNLSVVNAHFIAGAWSCDGNVEKRKDYWKKDWAVFKEETAKEHDKGYNVVATGDLNRPRKSDKCNPAWEPSSLHPDAAVVGGVGIDYIFAVPAKNTKFVLSKKADGTNKEGEITLGIDGHKAHWVSGKFLSK